MTLIAELGTKYPSFYQQASNAWVNSGKMFPFQEASWLVL